MIQALNHESVTFFIPIRFLKHIERRAREGEGVVMEHFQGLARNHGSHIRDVDHTTASQFKESKKKLQISFPSPIIVSSLPTSSSFPSMIHPNLSSINFPSISTQKRGHNLSLSIVKGKCTGGTPPSPLESSTTWSSHSL